MGLAACGNGANAPSVPTIKAPVTSPSYATLNFAVGTANIAGTTGLNTMVTLRQANGLTAYGYNTPVITWDGAFTNTSASVYDSKTRGKNVDDGLNQISGTPPLVLGQTVPASTFGSGTYDPNAYGTSWGAFSYGFNPSNSTTTGGPGALNYPCLPVYVSKVTAPGISGGSPQCNALTVEGAGAQYVGGPPAFPQIHGNALSGQLGSYLGFVPFAGLTPAPNPATGTSVFTLNVGVTSTQGAVTLTQTATMRNFTPLGLFATPTFKANGAGGGFISYALPAGVTEAYIIMVNLGPGAAGAAAAGGGGNYAFSPNCNFGPGPYFYTVRVTPSSPNPVGLGGGSDPGNNLAATPALGSLPAGKVTKTFCSKADNTAAATAGNFADPGSEDEYMIYAVGFDYPAYASSFPNSNGVANPTLVGANGQADLTMSDLSAITNYSGVGTPASSRRATHLKRSSI